MVVPFCIPAAVCECSYCSTSSSTFGIVSLPGFGYSNRCVVVSHCFASYFPDDTWYGTPFHMLVICTSSFVSVKVFGPISSWVIFLSFKRSLHILNNSPLADMFLSVPLLILLILPFTEEKFSILIHSSLAIISFIGCIFGVVLQKALPYPRHVGFLLCLHFKVHDPFCVNFCDGYKVCV